MRRLIFSLSALSLLAMAVGCTHTAGQCDCDGTGKPQANAMPAAKPEPIKELPKEAPKETEQASLETSEPPVNP